MARNTKMVLLWIFLVEEPFTKW